MIYKVPAAPEKYHYQLINGIHVYVAKDAALGSDKIRFTLRGLWLFRRITVSGIPYPKV
jgi:hypothetical protein